MCVCSWSRSLTVTPAGLDVPHGGSFAYSNILSEPLHDDPKMGAVAWDHHLATPCCQNMWPNGTKRILPQHCSVSLVTRFPLDF